MRTSKPKLVKCAGNCEKQLPHVDGHAIGWRPMCNDCYKDGKLGGMMNLFGMDVRYLSEYLL